VTSHMSSGAASALQPGPTVDSAWSLLRAASALADSLDRKGRFEVFGEDENTGSAHRVQYAVRFNLP